MRWWLSIFVAIASVPASVAAAEFYSSPVETEAETSVLAAQHRTNQFDSTPQIIPSLSESWLQRLPSQNFAADWIDVERSSSSTGIFDEQSGSECRSRGTDRLLPTGILPHFGSRSDESNRYHGLGPPLTTTSWLTHPSSIGMCFGGFDGEALVNHRVDQTNALFSGFQYGWDYDHHWGFEKRFGYAQLHLKEANLGAPTRHGSEVYGDYRLLFYPCGDFRWRPYFIGAIGGIEYRFIDDLGNAIHRPVFMTSYGIGLKRLIGERIAIRMELTDIVTFESGELSGAHSVACVGGIEYRFNIPKAMKNVGTKICEGFVH